MSLPAPAPPAVANDTNASTGRPAEAAPADAAAASKPTPSAVLLGPPRPNRSRAQVSQQVAQRLLAANPGLTYTSKPPAVLLAVPVLQFELDAEGRLKRIEVLRVPRQAKDTVDLARQALQRAAPFGSVRELPPPWVFVETFLFDDSRRFKPRSLE